MLKNGKEQYSLFRSVDCQIIGISQDPKNDHKEFSEENDLKEGNLGTGYRDGRKTIAEIILILMSFLTMSSCYYRLRATK